MPFRVIKRDGKIETFDFNKIKKAMGKAFKACNTEMPEELVQEVEFNLNLYSSTDMEVEAIQDIVEKRLMDSKFYDVAKAYILYRDSHKQTRFIKERLDYMSNYSQSTENAATASETDANSNVTIKNVANLEGEVYKTTNRIIQRQRMKESLNKLYPEVSKKYEEDLNNHIIYVHDESSTPTLKAYTYSPKESVYARIGETLVLCSFETLYGLSTATEIAVETGVYVKRPTDITILDKEGWTKVTQLTKKVRHRDLYRVKTAFGEDIIVTDNHPMIIGDSKNDTIEAKDCLNKTQLRLPNQITFKGDTLIDLATCVPVDYNSEKFVMRHEIGSPYYFAKRYVTISRELGYVIGFFIGDGNYDNTCHNLSFTQKDRMPLVQIADAIFDAFGVCSSIVLGAQDKWILTVHSNIVYDVFKYYFKIKDKAWNKSLPYNLLNFNKEFAAGIIEGIIDSDGTVTDNTISIRISSREAITQLTILLRAFGYGVANTVQHCPFGQNKAVKQNYTLWGVSFTNTTGSFKFCNSFKFNKTQETVNYLKYSTGIANITNVQKLDNCSFIELCDYIYDITTESNTLMCNNLWAHNCMAASLFPLMNEGTGNIDGITPSSPNDIQSFCGQFTNLIFLLSSQVKGAVATSEVFVALNYYIIKEFGDNWVDKLDEVCQINSTKERTIRNVILKGMKQIIYGINQPAGNRGYNSPLKIKNLFA